MTKALILVSDTKLSAMMKLYLGFNGFTTMAVSSIEEATKCLQEIHFDLMIIDIHRHKKNTFDFVRSLRHQGLFVPVLYLGARAYEEALISGTTGLDAYLVRPFNNPTLKARLNDLLEKSQSERRPLLYSGINVDLQKRLLFAGSGFVELGKMEMRILLLLARTAGSVVSLDKVGAVIEDNTSIFFHISVLRKKLEELGCEALRINFVKNGYRLEAVT